MAHNPNKDIELLQPPTDSISSLAFSPKANYLVAGSWDNQVRLNLIRISSFPLLFHDIHLSDIAASLLIESMCNVSFSMKQLCRAEHKLI